MININEELEKRLAEYQQSELLLLDIDALTFDYKAQGLSVPPEDQLCEEVIAIARKRLEDELTCEAEGHFWKEEGNPENGSSDLTCQRCGDYQNLQWQ